MSAQDHNNSPNDEGCEHGPYASSCVTSKTPRQGGMIPEHCRGISFFLASILDHDRKEHCQGISLFLASILDHDRKDCASYATIQARSKDDTSLRTGIHTCSGFPEGIATSSWVLALAAERSACGGDEDEKNSARLDGGVCWGFDGQGIVGRQV
ncbi:hypothetical protein HYQ46_005054 [Verticillium longisporum]|nr:hypothetical protein HYQ46_005054 [Verticillium longisporum]